MIISNRFMKENKIWKNLPNVPGTFDRFLPNVPGTFDRFLPNVPGTFGTFGRFLLFKKFEYFIIF